MDADRTMMILRDMPSLRILIDWEFTGNLGLPHIIVRSVEKISRTEGAWV